MQRKQLTQRRRAAKKTKATTQPSWTRSRPRSDLWRRQTTTLRFRIKPLSQAASDPHNSSNTVSNDSNRLSELKRVKLIAEVMHDLGHDQIVKDLANICVASKSVANVIDQALSVDLLFGGRSAHVDGEEVPMHIWAH